MLVDGGMLNTNFSGIKGLSWVTCTTVTSLTVTIKILLSIGDLTTLVLGLNTVVSLRARLMVFEEEEGTNKLLKSISYSIPLAKSSTRINCSFIVMLIRLFSAPGSTVVLSCDTTSSSKAHVLSIMILALDMS